jgi:hypothetical protein
MPTLDAGGAKKTSLRITVNPTRKSTKTAGSATYQLSTENNKKSMRTSLLRLKTTKPSTHAQTKHSPPKLVVINEGLVINAPKSRTHTRKNKNESSGSALSSIGSLFSRRPATDPKFSYKQWKANLNANIAAKSAKYKGTKGAGKAFTAFMTKNFIGETKNGKYKKESLQCH